MWGKKRPALTQASLGGLRRNEEERGCLYLKRRGGGEEEQHVRRRAEATEEEEERLSVWKGEGRMSERGARSSHTKAGRRRRRMKLFGRSTLGGGGAPPPPPRPPGESVGGDPFQHKNWTSELGKLELLQAVPKNVGGGAEGVLWLRDVGGAVRPEEEERRLSRKRWRGTK